jgi:hypothetical protein
MDIGLVPIELEQGFPLSLGSIGVDPTLRYTLVAIVLAFVFTVFAMLLDQSRR